MKPLAQNSLIQNRYLIVHLIGKGGMGEVYLAVDQRLGSAVALKRTFFAGDESLSQAFEREARILARLRHPVLPKVSDHFGEGDEQYIVMEHISGDDLSKRLEASAKAFPVSWVMFWADQLLDALSYLHSHEPSIIHRDIKPQNLKLTDENHIVLLDFGLSKSSTGKTNILTSNESGSTGTTGSTASIVGYTPHYAPMEQIRGIGTSARSDLYSLSATLYQLLSNNVPIDALSRADSLISGIGDPIKPLNKVNPEISQGVSDVIMKGMDISQEKRYETAREMQKELRRAFTSMQGEGSGQSATYSGSLESPSEVQSGSSPAFDKTEVMDAGQLAAISNVLDQADNSDNLPPADNQPKQSDVKTEVFSAGVNPFPIIEEPVAAPPPSVEIPEVPAGNDDWAMTQQFNAGMEDAAGTTDQSGFSPDATMPIMNMGNQEEAVYDSYAQEQEQATSFDDTGINEDEESDQLSAVAAAGMGTSQGFSSSPQDAHATKPVAAAVAPAKKKRSAGKIMGIFFVLFLLFGLIAGGVIGGVYLYQNGQLAGLLGEEPTPTPTPEPTPEPTPTPTPESTPDESNSNGMVTDDNSNSQSISEPTPLPDVTPNGIDVTRPTPRPTVKPRPTQQGPRPTPKPAPTRAAPRATPLQ